MVMDDGPPFRHTLHSSLDERKNPPLSLVLKAVGAENEQQFLDFHVPSLSGSSVFEIINIVFTSAYEKKGIQSPECSSPNNGMLGYLFLQFLDSKGRPSGHPFPVARCDTSTGDGVSSAVRLPLQSDQRVRFYLVRKCKLGCNIMESNTHINGVCFVGNFRLISAEACINLWQNRSQFKALAKKELKFKTCGDSKDLHQRNNDTTVYNTRAKKRRLS
ncbi:hypothetical protein TRVL_04416 [Trypanosoma vivax]|nr:hypothetical protein TRVL_04416 [Trypanosoma vivax]